MAKGKWSEVGVEEIDFMPFIDTTNTVEKWRKWAQDENIFVKVKTDSTNAKNNGEIQIERCNAVADIPIGILRSITGDPSAFPKKFMASVAVLAWDCNVDGGETGALADEDFGKRIQPDTDGKATIVDSGGYGRTVGGTKENLRYAFDFRDHFR